MDRDKLHLLHARDAIIKIEDYTSNIDLNTFSKNDQTYDAVMMQIIIIGESINSLSDEFKEKHHDLPWHQAVGLRNQTAHGYFDIDPSIVWQTIKEDLPELKEDIKKILEKY